MIVLTTDQRTPAWAQARVGRFTASRAADVLAKIKSGEAAARRDYRLQLVCERLTGVSQENGYSNATMDRGTELEPVALAAYEALSGELVRPAGFLAHDSLQAGCSPDGLVGVDGGVEVKCPKTSTHLTYLRNGVVPEHYVPQLLHCLWITGRRFWDFFSYDDRLPVHLQTFMRRVYADDVDLPGYELTARLFLSEVEREVEALQALAEVGR